MEKKLLHLNLLMIISLLSIQVTNAQIIAKSANSSATVVNFPSPKGIEASDGTYDKFVLIRWEATEKATDYKVLRTTSPKATTLQEISNGWQKSTWICDYSAQPNVDYYYTVVATNGKETSSIGELNKGFLKKKEDIVIEDKELLAENEAYGTQKKIFLLASSLNPNKNKYLSAERVSLSTYFQNIFDQPTPKTEIRIYLSLDNILDWNDQLLHTKSLSSLPANVNFKLTEEFHLPENMLDGVYHLIVVTSPENAILDSKIISTTITVINQ